MGAEIFLVHAEGETAQQAFLAAVAQASYDYGHAGYTGTIAEKDSFVMIDLPQGMDAEAYAHQLINEGDNRIDDKWGDAGCIKTDLGWLFFGWASS